MQRTKIQIKEQQSIYQRLKQQNQLINSNLSKHSHSSHKKTSQNIDNYHSELINKNRIYQIRHKLKKSQPTNHDKDILYFDAIKNGINIQRQQYVSPITTTNKSKSISNSNYQELQRYRTKTQNPQSKRISLKSNQNISLNNITPKLPSQPIIQFSTIQTKKINSNQLSFNLKNKDKKIKFSSQINQRKHDKKINISRIGLTKRQSQKLQRLSMNQTILQSQISQKHKQTKHFIQQIKFKYHLNFNKHKIYLKNHKKMIKYSLPQIQFNQQDDIHVMQAQCEHLMHQVNQLDVLLQEKHNLIEKLSFENENNRFNLYLRELQQNPKGIPLVISQEEQDDEQSKVNIQFIDKLRNQLNRIRQYNNNNISQQQSQHKFTTKNSLNSKIKINERLKDLIF